MPGMTPKALRSAVREKHPEAAQKDIVRAAFYALIESAVPGTIAAWTRSTSFALAERIRRRRAALGDRRAAEEKSAGPSNRPPPEAAVAAWRGPAHRGARTPSPGARPRLIARGWSRLTGLRDRDVLRRSVLGPPEQAAAWAVALLAGVAKAEFLQEPPGRDVGGAALRHDGAGRKAFAEAA